MFAALKIKIIINWLEELDIKFKLWSTDKLWFSLLKLPQMETI